MPGLTIDELDERKELIRRQWRVRQRLAKIDSNSSTEHTSSTQLTIAGRHWSLNFALDKDNDFYGQLDLVPIVELIRSQLQAQLAELTADLARLGLAPKEDEP